MLYNVFLESVGCRKESKRRYFDTDILLRFQVILDIFYSVSQSVSLHNPNLRSYPPSLHLIDFRVPPKKGSSEKRTPDRRLS